MFNPTNEELEVVWEKTASLLDAIDDIYLAKSEQERLDKINIYLELLKKYVRHVQVYNNYESRLCR